MIYIFPCGPSLSVDRTGSSPDLVVLSLPNLRWIWPRFPEQSHQDVGIRWAGTDDERRQLDVGGVGDDVLGSPDILQV